jgi:hypothetical protein
MTTDDITFKKEDLVALIWGSNTCHTKVVDPDYVSERQVYDGEDKKHWKWAKLKLDLKEGTWKHGKKEAKIGKHFRDPCGIWSENRYGLIGIYDRTNLEHLDSMVDDAQAATESRSGGCWD